MQEARLAKEKMHGRLACGRPLVVRLVSERSAAEMAESLPRTSALVSRSSGSRSSSGQMGRGAKIAAIKNKLKALEEDAQDGTSTKKRKQLESAP